MCLWGYHHLFYIALCNRLVTVHLTGTRELQKKWINSHNFITWVNVEFKQKWSQQTQKKKNIYAKYMWCHSPTLAVVMFTYLLKKTSIE